MTLVSNQTMDETIVANLKKRSLFNVAGNHTHCQLPVLERLLELSKLQRLESVSYHYASFVYSHLSDAYSSAKPEAVNLVVLASAAIMTGVNQQNVCLSFSELQRFTADLVGDEFDLPDFAKWPEVLCRFPSLIAAAQDADSRSRALWVLDENFVYLKRYADYEDAIVKRVLESVAKEDVKPTDALAKYIDNLFPQDSSEIDWQRIAVQSALLSRFYVISGGPGTGKTTTVVKLLLAIIKRFEQRQAEVRIRLAAPTGKAAARLSESLRQSLSHMKLDNAAMVPTEAETLHRMLKRLPNGEFFYNKQKPLPADVVVVDEASMVDLSMMAKLVDGLEPHCQLILLGDKNQLSSVEAGNVLAEISDAQEELNINVVTELQKSYRFDGKGEIGRLAGAVKAGNQRVSSELLSSEASSESEVAFWPEQDSAFQKVQEHVYAHFQKLYDLLLGLTRENEQSRIHQTFSELRKLQVLACTKLSAHGVEAFNFELAKTMKQKNRIPQWQLHFSSRPIMVTENAYNLNLYNGDIGIEACDPVTGQVMAYFPDLSELGYRKVASQRLPKHESVYAMTVHKSQGSEFEHTMMLLPQREANNNIVTRELLYTGLTRAKKKFTLIGSLQVVQSAVANQSVRLSGIKLKLKRSLNRES